MVELNHETSFPLKTQELICRQCGGTFFFRKGEQEKYSYRGWQEPKRCPACRKAAMNSKREEAERLGEERRQRENIIKQKIFEEKLKNRRIVPVESISPKSDRVLYVIGNGFDLMHRVRSNYYAFRDSLGKRSRLREALEYILTPEDIWADFEDSLAHFDGKAMGSSFMIDNYLDNFDAYSKDAGAADFFLSVETAVWPLMTIVHELPQRFRTWVEQLTVGTGDRPLKNIFRDGKVLCFNYTEFAETLYGVSNDHVCYIHGCRAKKKDKLILGHLQGASDSSYLFPDDRPLFKRSMADRYLIDAAREHVFRLISECDEALTKDCNAIIDAHKGFFTGLSDIEEVIVIGHSLAPVDWDYFAEIVSNLRDPEGVHWYFGCHSLRDLENLEQLVVRLSLNRDQVSVFRTDVIRVSPPKDVCPHVTARPMPTAKKLSVSRDGRWQVQTAGSFLSILDLKTNDIVYKACLSSVNKAFFTPSDEYLFVVIGGVEPGIFLYRLLGEKWGFVSELESIMNQNLLNPRLRHIFLTGEKVTFVYNNRVRDYDLSTGTLAANYAKRNAANDSYEGQEILSLFTGRERKG